jgi:hypothetical protein
VRVKASSRQKRSRDATFSLLSFVREHRYPTGLACAKLCYQLVQNRLVTSLQKCAKQVGHFSNMRCLRSGARANPLGASWQRSIGGKSDRPVRRGLSGGGVRRGRSPGALAAGRRARKTYQGEHVVSERHLLLAFDPVQTAVDGRVFSPKPVPSATRRQFMEMKGKRR